MEPPQPQHHQREHESPTPPPPPPPPPLPPPPPSQNGSSAAAEGAGEADRDKSRRLMSEALQREDEFLEYLMSLSTTAAPAAADSGSAQDSGVAEEEEAAPAAGPVRSASGSSQPQPPRTAGLDHLDNLCKLMEQLGDLKEQNTKLQRRVQYLEDLKRLQVMHKQLRGEDADAGPGQPSARGAAGGGRASPAGAADPSARGRSRSVGVHVQQPQQQQRQSPQKSKAKVSKWTKVKEAFRWERAAFADHGQHHQQQQAQNKSHAARLAAAAAATAATRASPSSSSSSSDDLDIHMHFSEIFPDTGGPGSSGGGSVSAAESRRLSFPEEEHDEEARRSRSLDADAITSQLSGKDISPLSKSPSGKAHRTPWGKVKDIIIQTRKDSLKRRGAGAGSTDAHLDSASDGTADGGAPHHQQPQQDGDASKAGQAPRLTLTLASSEELRWPEQQQQQQQQSPHRPPPKPSPSPVTDPEDDRRHNQQGSPPPCRRHSSKWTKVKKAFLTARQEDAGSPPYSPREHAAFEYNAQTGEGDEVTSENLQAEIQRSYEELQHKLSLEFHEKLAEWERARLAVAASAAGGASEATGGAALGPEEQQRAEAQQRAADKCFRRKMDEWERLRHHHQQHPLSADFRKKLHEWQRRKDAGPGAAGGRHASLPGTALGGDGGEGGSPRTARKANKELLWLEKELHKIAREKQRLERERDKFLQREARLEKMRSAMRAGQEVLVQTSTGSFRFQGISEAFTRRLFEWEQARGIGPEDSTFALLDPRYRPRPRQPAAIDENGGSGREGECAPLSRCKSAGSVATPGGLSLTRQASSLSLNDAQLEASAAAAAGTAPQLEDGRAVSEPRLRTEALEEGDGDGEDAEDGDGPSAVIVDVEDEVVETAGPLAAAPAVLGHTPVYCYAPREVTRLIDSSGSESDRDRNAIGGVCRNESVRTERSYRLLDENVDLLNKLKNNEDVCRKLEAEIEELEAKMEEAARNREQQLQNLEKASEARQVALLRARVRELERRHERLKRQGATLQDSFAARSEQQAALACHLVGNMKQLQLQDPGLGDPLAFVRDLSTQVLHLSEQLAAAVRERGGGPSAATRRHRLASGLTWLSADGISLSADSLQDECPDGRPDLRELPALLTSKVLELKRGLSFLCGTDRPGDTAAEEARAAVRSRRNARQSQVQGAASSGSDSDDDEDEDDDDDENDDEGDGSAQPVQAAVGGVPAAFYETEVPPASKAGCYRHKKLLRARRVSDTHVGYRATESPGAGRQRDTDDSDNSAHDGDRRSVPRRSPPRSRSRLADSEGGSPRAGRVYALAENGTGRNSGCEEDADECSVSSGRQGDKDGGLPELRHRIAPSEPEGAFAEQPEEEVEQGDEEDVPTNVFVKTTRKIFSPVRRDSKGKASSVIGFVVGDGVNSVRGNRGSRRESVDSGGREKKEDSVGAQSGGSVPETPVQVTRHSRSQSASPAVVRRPSTASKEGSSSADTSSSGTSACDSKPAVTGAISTYPERLSEDRLAEENRNGVGEEITDTSAKAGRNKATELVAADHIPPPTGLPPVSHSPMSSRRGGGDQLRPPTKETAPSIRMMIAKYNKNLEGASAEASGGGGSTGSAVPNGTVTAGGSPVAWRSPATERRVRLQMEKYQEEVRRALESGGVPNTGSGRHVQKSASVGFIPASPVSRSAGGSPRKPPSGAAAAAQTKGILKSSSASAIQADLSQGTRGPAQETVNETSVSPPPALSEDSSAKTQEAGVPVQAVTPQPVRATSRSTSASPLSLLRPSVSPATSNPSSPELVQRKSLDGGSGGATSSPPPSRLRALRLKRAKEEFLTRGPASRSWTASPSAGEASPTPPLSAGAGCRLSFAGSADSSPLRPAPAGRAAHDEAQLLVKSASAGAISPTSQHQQPPRAAASDAAAAAAPSSKAPRFGLASSIASRFRKVKMRRAGRGHGQQQQGQGAVSALCRQSLLVDLGGDAAERAAAAAPATKSCPSSPVLRRPPQPPPPRPPASPTNDDESKSSCWVKKKIFRPKS